MPGPINLNQNTIKPKTHYAKRNSNGQWVAGPKAKGYSEGQFIPTKEVKVGNSTRKEPGGIVGNQWSQRRRSNLVKSVMRAQDISEKEARELTGEMLEELKTADSDNERAKIWQRYAS